MCPLVIPQTQTQDAYVDATTFGGPGATPAVIGTLNVGNATIFARLIMGSQGQARETSDIQIAPALGIPLAGGTREPILGLKVRSAVAGSPAQVWGVLYYQGEATLLGGQQFSGTVSASGQVTPSPSGAMQVIQDQLLTAPAAAVTFANIPQTFAHLLAEWSLRSDGATNNQALRVQLNGDGGADYDLSVIRGNAGVASSISAFAQTSGYLGEIPAATAPAGSFGPGELIVPDYTNSARLKSLTGKSHAKGGTVAADMWQHEHGTDWRSTAAVTQLSFFPAVGNFVAGSRITLYGLTSS